MMVSGAFVLMQVFPDGFESGAIIAGSAAAATPCDGTSMSDIIRWGERQRKARSEILRLPVDGRQGRRQARRAFGPASTDEAEKRAQAADHDPSGPRKDVG